MIWPLMFAALTEVVRVGCRSNRRIDGAKEDPSQSTSASTACGSLVLVLLCSCFTLVEGLPFKIQSYPVTLVIYRRKADTTPVASSSIIASTLH